MPIIIIIIIIIITIIIITPGSSDPSWLRVEIPESVREVHTRSRHNTFWNSI